MYIFFSLCDTPLAHQREASCMNRSLGRSLTLFTLRFVVFSFCKRTVGRAVGPTVGRADGRTDGQSDGRTDSRTDSPTVRL